MTDATALEDLIKAYDVRGVVPEPFSTEVARAIGAAFAEVVVTPSGGRTAVIGRDMRSSGPALVEAFADGLTARGVDVVLIGLCSTDGLYHASGALRFPGAMFTASHNPAQYNGIKMCHAGARPVGQDTGLEDIHRLAGRFLREGLPTAADQPGTVTEREMLPEYAAFLRSLVDLSGIRPLKVVVDAGNGMAGLTAPAVLGEAVGLPALPLDVVDLYFELDGSFPNHEANPLDPKNLVDLQAAVVANGADIGLAFDGDADRCFVIDERGAPVSPSAVTVLVGLREVARELAAGRTPTVIHNLITSRAVPALVVQPAGLQHRAAAAAERRGGGRGRDGQGARRCPCPGAGRPAGGQDRGRVMQPWVRDILRCPACGSPLRDSTRADGAAELVCTGAACALAYPVRDGIPVLLVDEAYPAPGTV